MTLLHCTFPVGGMEGPGNMVDITTVIQPQHLCVCVCIFCFCRSDCKHGFLPISHPLVLWSVWLVLSNMKRWVLNSTSIFYIFNSFFKCVKERKHCAASSASGVKGLAAVEFVQFSSVIQFIFFSFFLFCVLYSSCMINGLIYSTQSNNIQWYYVYYSFSQHVSF